MIVPVILEMGSMVVVVKESTAIIGVDSTMLGDAVLTMAFGEVVSMMVSAVMPMMVGDVVSTSMSMSMADEAISMLMAVGDAESTAVIGGEPLTLVDVNKSAMVGEGASESVDLDPVVPTVGAN
jgi:hypothetical protein